MKEDESESIIELELFPDKRFYKQNFKYNEEGRLMYSDGAYHINSLDTPHYFHHSDFSHRDFVKNK